MTGMTEAERAGSDLRLSRLKVGALPPPPPPPDHRDGPKLWEMHGRLVLEAGIMGLTVVGWVLT